MAAASAIVTISFCTGSSPSCCRGSLASILSSYVQFRRSLIDMPEFEYIKERVEDAIGESVNPLAWRMLVNEGELTYVTCDADIENEVVPSYLRFAGEID